jgi:hypothetical protein
VERRVLEDSLPGSLPGERASAAFTRSAACHAASTAAPRRRPNRLPRAPAAARPGYSTTATSWRQQAYIKASNGDQFDAFGFSISLSENGNVLAVGARSEGSAATGINGSQDNATAGAGSGAAYVFRRSGTTWT